MSPEESWLQIARLGVVKNPQRTSMGTHLRDTDPDDRDYHGISLTPNMPIFRTPDFRGAGLLTLTLL